MEGHVGAIADVASPRKNRPIPDYFVVAHEGGNIVTLLWQLNGVR